MMDEKVDAGNVLYSALLIRAGDLLCHIRDELYKLNAAAQPVFPPLPVYWDELSRTSIDELELSTRSHRALWNDSIETIRQLVDKPEEELLRIPNFGKKSLREVREALDAFRSRRREVNGNWPGGDYQD
jgi:DNA-directed RNA polymerase alpha subunit